MADPAGAGLVRQGPDRPVFGRERGVRVKILLTGKTGQLGYELERSLQLLGEVVAVTRKQMDLADRNQIREVIRSVKLNLIVNPAAYTAVDQAEKERDMAIHINADAPATMAQEPCRLGAALVHYSTDYVFDGCATGPYTEDDATGPCCAYGKSKLAGEQAIAATGVPHLIFRTSWVYGMRGKNFLLTVLRLACERDELRIVADQHGAPTWSRTIADATAQILVQAGIADDASRWWQQKSGVYSLTCTGQTTWHAFAQAIVDNASLQKKRAVFPISSDQYLTPAHRPSYSVLSHDKIRRTFSIGPPRWEAALALCMAPQ
jgi:dTDP-4-dehydrorhamnose reductase